jgi:hypothetical protein
MYHVVAPLSGTEVLTIILLIRMMVPTTDAVFILRKVVAYDPIEPTHCSDEVVIH